MDRPELWLSLVYLIAWAALCTPRLLRAARIKRLRNLAIWLGIFLLLVVVYRYCGPFKVFGQVEQVTDQSVQHQDR